MKARVASGVAAVVCALAGSAWAAGNHKACLEGGKKACIELGTVVANDEPPVGDVDELRADCGKTQDRQSCASLLREETKASCRKGNQRACEVLGESEARRVTDEAKGTTEDLEASCKKTKKQACVDLAVRLMEEAVFPLDNLSEDDHKRALEEKQKRAMALLERSCKAGAVDGCARLGMILLFSGKESDAKRGLKLLKRSCAMGSKAGCAFEANFRPPPQPKVIKPGDKSMGPGILGVLKADDVDQVVRDLTKLSKLLEQNCKLGYADACAELEKRDEHDPANEKDMSSAELAAKIRKLEKQAAGGPAPKK